MMFSFTLIHFIIDNHYDREFAKSITSLPLIPQFWNDKEKDEVRCTEIFHANLTEVTQNILWSIAS